MNKVIQKTISITGSNGFIGGNLKNHFLSCGYQINCLVRELPGSAEPNVTYIKFDLEKPIDEDTFPPADMVFHCAFSQFSPKLKNSNEININGTRNILEICRSKNIKIVFFSSLSAHKDAESNYGKNKFYLESLFDPRRDLILKLGLVIGEGGIFAAMEQIIRKSKFIPLIDGGRQLIYTVAIEDLITICKISVDKNISGKFNIGKRIPISLKQIYLLIGEKINRKNYFIPISSSFLVKTLSVTERLGLTLPISTENLLGLKQNKEWDTTLGMELFRGHPDSASLEEYMEI